MEGIPPWTDLAQQTKLGHYKHFKGDHYELLKVVRHSETGEELAVYQSQKHPDRIWARPLMMFMEEVHRDGYDGPRFIYLGD